MPTRITMNGVTYDGVDAMPADVRRRYEQLRAKFPNLGDLSDVQPEVVQGDWGPFHYSATVRKKIVVNDKTYDDEGAMPPEVRRTFNESMRAARSSEPDVKKNELKVSFQVNGPTFTIGGKATPGPIEPGSVEGRLRVALLLGAGVLIAGVVWLYLSIH